MYSLSISSIVFFKSIRGNNLSVNQNFLTCNDSIIPILVNYSSISIKGKNLIVEKMKLARPLLEFKGRV